MSISHHIASLRGLVRRRSGSLLSSMSGLEALSGSIEQSTGIKLSVSTLRRTLGIVASTHEPSVLTLDALSRFVGYRDWCHFTANYHDGESQSKFLNEQLVTSSELSEGDEVEIEWAPARLLRLTAKGFEQFEVTLSINSRLAEGDTLTTHVICLHQPFVATNIKRRTRTEKVYVAAQEGGVSAIRVKRRQ